MLKDLITKLQNPAPLRFYKCKNLKFKIHVKKRMLKDLPKFTKLSPSRFSVEHSEPVVPGHESVRGTG